MLGWSSQFLKKNKKIKLEDVKMEDEYGDVVLGTKLKRKELK